MQPVLALVDGGGHVIKEQLSGGCCEHQFVAVLQYRAVGHPQRAAGLSSLSR